jgi:hypothetical protein
LFVGHSLQSADYEILTDLSPTHEAKKFHRLKVALKIPFDFDDKEFFALPTSLTVDAKGNIYIYDAKQLKIYSFDKSGKYLKSFGGPGEGPGEMAASMGTIGGYDIRRMYFQEKVGLLVNGYRNKWINVFDANGKLIREIRLSDRKKFYPVMDDQQNLYKLSSYDGVIQVVNKDSQIIDTLLDTKELLRFYRYEPFDLKWISSIKRTDTTNIFYDLLSDNRFIIYLRYSSTIYIFKNRKLIDQYPVRPKRALGERQYRIDLLNRVYQSKEYKAMVKRNPRHVNNSFTYHFLFRELVVDKDTGDHFYLESFEAIEKKQNMIFKFAINGELIEALYFNPPEKEKEYCFVREKKNNFYYSIGQKFIYVLER